ncbi:YKE2 [Blepharisma stoltei]|uniref:Prefoldin subunit 6 n=1 Tax=Blepharisma stoltei TaxID=1481888 RepID=A0AAU9K0E1_9CILI|nr:unnamed protein product [Blepharisma stoltei]
MAEEIEKELADLRKIQKEVGKLESMRQDYILKKHENDMVKEEFDQLQDEESKVYKLIGPALISQSLSEAKNTVDKRLEFITKEITRLEKLKEDFLKKAEEKQTKIMQLQKSIAARGK